MKHATAGRRQRNRNGGGSRRGNQNRMQVYDSNGPDVRIRGTAHQVAEKYLALAKDATSAGDPIMSENYYQHAEHYIRIINEISGETKIAGLKDDVQDGNKLDSSSYNKEKTRSKPVNKSVEKTESKKDDLALPASILGGAVKADESNGGDKKQVADAPE